MHRTRFLAAALLLSFSGLIQVARADVKVLQVGGGVVIPTPMGYAYDYFSRNTGFEGETWLTADEILGAHLLAHAGFTYQPYQIRGLDSITMRQYQFMAGIESRIDENTFFLKPFAALDIGFVHSRLIYSTSDTSNNSDTSFAFSFRPGIALPIIGGVSLAYSMPILFILDKSKFISLSNIISLRFAL